jgi:hypothetical protein
MPPKNKAPTTGQTVAGATRFQQSKQILSLALHKFVAIFSMRVLCLGDLLPMLAVVLALVARKLPDLDAVAAFVRQIGGHHV